MDGFVEALEAAFDLGDDDRDRRAARVRRKTGRRARCSSYFDGQRLRFDARRSAARGADDEAVTAFEAAIDRFLDTGHVYWQAMTRLETAEHHVARGRPEAAEPLLAQAREVFESIGARPALERVAALERQTGQQRRRHRRLSPPAYRLGIDHRKPHVDHGRDVTGLRGAGMSQSASPALRGRRPRSHGG